MGSDQERLTIDVPRKPCVAYVVSRFPKITETFVLHEMLALEELGVRVELFPLLRQKGGVAHAEAQDFVRRAHFVPLLSWAIVAANLRCLVCQPWSYLTTVFLALWHTLPSPRFFAGALFLLPRAVLFARTMRRLGVEHVHAHFASHSALAALIVHRLSGIPFSFTAHGSDLHVDQTALRWKLRQADWAVTVSEYNREFVRSRLGEAAAGKLHVIHCGVDTSRFVREREPGDETFEILCVAALRGVKGHVHLIEACRRLRARGLPFRCHIVGSGPLGPTLRRQVARCGLEDQVRFHGALAQEAVLERMRAAHTLVLCSVQDRAGRREGIPVVLMEAMSCGLPVVASRISGIPELVLDGHSGFLTPPGDARAIAEALERLARFPEERRCLGQAGRATVLRSFDLRLGILQLAAALVGDQERLRSTRDAFQLFDGDGCSGAAGVVLGGTSDPDGARDHPVALPPDRQDLDAMKRSELRA